MQNKLSNQRLITPATTQRAPDEAPRNDWRTAVNRLGQRRLIATADDRHLNPLGGVHGGFAATVLDSATACAVHAALDAGVGYGTVDLNVKMVRPVPRNQELIAEGRLLNLSRTIAIAEATLTDAQGKLYAHATCTCSINRG